MPELVVRGRRVHYTDQGGGAAPLLLVHGHTGALDDFDAVAPALAEDRRVLAVDLPGHGGSEGADAPEAYALDLLAEWLLLVSDELGLDRFHLLGHSLGGLIAQRAAVAAPERLASLVLMGTGLGAIRDEALVFIRQVADVCARDGIEAAFDESVRGMEEAPLDPELKARRAGDRDYLRARYLRLNPAALIGGVRELATAEPVAHLLRLDVPVLVVHGADDYAWTGEEQAALASAIPGARHEVIPLSYHSPQKENPDAWLAVVRAFLGDADRRSNRVPA